MRLAPTTRYIVLAWAVSWVSVVVGCSPAAKTKSPEKTVAKPTPAVPLTPKQTASLHKTNSSSKTSSPSNINSSPDPGPYSYKSLHVNSEGGVLHITLGEPETNNPVADFTVQDKLIRPTHYRRWVHLGTRLAPNDKNPEADRPLFHNVYVHPKAFAQYRKNGTFPNDTIIVREIVSVGKSDPDAEGPFMGDFVGLEAAVKDAVRFKDEPGNWAYFDFGKKYPLAEIAEIQRADQCSECHKSRAGKTDFVFTRYYPALRAVSKTDE